MNCNLCNLELTEGEAYCYGCYTSMEDGYYKLQDIIGGQSDQIADLKYRLQESDNLLLEREDDIRRLNREIGDLNSKIRNLEYQMNEMREDRGW